MSEGILGVLTAVEKIKASHPDVEFIYKDLGAKKIGERLNELNNLALTIGFQGATGLTMYANGKINVATVALYNEFGTKDSPARPFMRRTINENLREIEAAFAFAFAQVVELKAKPIPAMAAVGRFIAQAMVEAIDTALSWAIPNSEGTIFAKGANRPLIDTGLMKKSITWAVRKGGPLGPVVKQGKA